MLTEMIDKYKKKPLGKKYLIPNTLKERVENFQSLPRYCPVMISADTASASISGLHDYHLCMLS